MSVPIKNICCIGAGYVGGPTMSVIANNCPNIQINIVDINKQRIDLWNSEDLNNLPIYEPGLDEIIEKCRNKNLHFSVDLEKSIASSDMVFISVNTPTKTKGVGAGKAIDLKWVEASARQIAQYAKGYTIVVEKSTLPIRTAETIKEILVNSKSSQDNKNKNFQTFDILSNPEFLAEGSAINDLQNPDRVLIGGENIEAINALKEIYLHWINESKILSTNLWSSELSKLIANAFLAQRISSINSVSALCEKTGADVAEVALAISKDKRIGKYFLETGPGFGGSCFKKDILNLTYICEYYGLKEVSKYWEEVININKWQKKRITNLVIDKLFGTISQKKITILGFSFKSNTNDTRESPAIDICKELLEEDCNLVIYDPRVDPNQIRVDLENSDIPLAEIDNQQGKWAFSKSIIEASSGAHAILILTEWQEFKMIDWDQISQNMKRPAWVFDTRSISNLKEAKSHGLNTWRIGNSY